MDRYFVRHDLHATGPRLWNVVDRHDGGYDRNTGARYVAQCPDPEMAQRIADLLNIEGKLRIAAKETLAALGRVKAYEGVV